MTNLLTRRPLLAAAAVVLSVGIGAGVASGITSDGPDQINPDTLAQPASVARPAWVRADGSIDQSHVPAARDTWALPDGRIDCSRAPATMAIATYDGRILLDAAGRQVQMPSLTGCSASDTPEFTRAWTIRVAKLQLADARARRLAIPDPPQVLASPVPELPAGGIAPEGGAR